MIHLDSNVLIRLLIDDSPAQTARARAFLSNLSPQNRGYVSLVVLAEVAGVLARYYKQPREQLADLVDLLLNSAEMQVEQAALVRDTVQVFRTTSAGFIDCLIAQVGAAAKCEYTVTFDKGAAKLPGMRLLE